jgi:hypothetical protein
MSIDVALPFIRDPIRKLSFKRRTIGHAKAVAVSES